MKKKQKHGYTRRDGWYEVVDTSVDAKLIRNVEEAEGFRCFVRGPISDIHIVEVPTDMPEPARNALGRKLSSLGVSVLLVNENIKFYKLRRATPDEEKRLDAIEKEKDPPPSPSTPTIDEASDSDGVGPVVAGDGSECDRFSGGADLQDHDSDGSTGSGEDHRNP